MTPAAILMKMQELDLALDRDEQTLRELPELKELARKRAAYQKLKSEEARLLGVRKDLEAEIEDLVAEQKATEDEVTITQEDAQRLKDYREVQALEVELSDLAKKLDKIAFSLNDKHRALAEARERETKVSQYTQKFEESLVAEAQATKEAVTEVQERVASARREREACAANIDQELLQRYTASVRAHHGIGVEVLHGDTPSVCRMKLTEASLEDLAREGDIATCPYCGRLLLREEPERA